MVRTFWKSIASGFWLSTREPAVFSGSNTENEIGMSASFLKSIGSAGGSFSDINASDAMP